MPMKFIKFVTLMLTTCSISFAHYDIRIDMFQNHQTFEKANPDVIFAGYPGLKYRCYVEGGKLDSSTCKGNYFQWMLNLKYDLDVAENQCNWLAKEMISKELLETIGGKYGLSEMDSRDDSKFSNEIIEFQNMAALHASIAMEQMAVQRKTTEIMKKHLEGTDISKIYGEIPDDYELELDKNLNKFLQQTNIESDELKIKRPTLQYSGNNVKDILELASVLDNPAYLDAITNRIMETYCAKRLYWIESELHLIPNISVQDKEVYTNAIQQFVDEIFDFKHNTLLKKIAIEYFLKIYNKAEQFLKYSKDEINLKFRDCSAIDIFGKTDVCSYNSMLELTRRNSDNSSFVTVCGTRDLNKIKNVVNFFTILKQSFRLASNDGDSLIYNARIDKFILQPLLPEEWGA